MANSIAFESLDPNETKWSIYYERFFVYMKATNVTAADQQAAKLLAAICREPYVLLKTIVTPQVPTELTCEEIGNALLHHYKPSSTSVMNSFEFYKRKQLANESAKDFLAN